MLNESCAAGLSQTHLNPIGDAHGLLPAGAGNPVVVSAHLDTIFPVDAHLPARRQAGQLVGPGIGDNAIGHAALAELALDLRSASLPAAIWYVATVVEEALGDLRGVHAVVDRFGDRVAADLVPEGMALGRIYRRALPSLRYRITSRTRGGHSWVRAGCPATTPLLCLVSLAERPGRASTRTGTITAVVHWRRRRTSRRRRRLWEACWGGKISRKTLSRLSTASPARTDCVRVREAAQVSPGQRAGP